MIRARIHAAEKLLSLPSVGETPKQIPVLDLIEQLHNYKSTLPEGKIPTVPGFFSWRDGKAT